ncbi:MAG TPA: LuxR C-terminal-related transcriptional regulator, partial [Anaerolineae bacterium]|nr:LuxR C-terminal-related transcriptional regulator [Anaerolineae bacterium]
DKQNLQITFYILANAASAQGQYETARRYAQQAYDLTKATDNHCLIAEGMTNQQIAEALVISVGTAKFYTSQIYSKLNVSSRTQAVARARDLNLLSWLTIPIFLLQPLLASGFSAVL